MRLTKLCLLLVVPACNAEPTTSATLGDTGTMQPQTSTDDGVDDGADVPTPPDDAADESTDDGPAGPFCGNNIIDGEDFCDGTDLAGYTCEVLGFEAGELGCTANCSGHDLTGCGFFECGNGKEEGDEDCDGTVGEATCATEGFDNGVLFCTPQCEYNFDQCGTCGDRIITDGEDCDIALPLQESCQSLGLLSGTLSCGDDCLFDLTNCSSCGNGVQEAGEVCDGADLNGSTCLNEGFDSGVLTCQNNCSFNFGADCGTCGNDLIDGAETCDGVDFGGDTCVTAGFDTGQLQCNAACDEVSTDGCGACGNGVIEDGETCDGALLAGETCLTQGFDSGTLACGNPCQLDFDGCGTCGNALIDGDEVCDTINFGATSCLSEGFDSGGLSCNATCDAISTAACGTCGNGIIDGGETCDGAVLGGQTCGSLGLEGGTLGCNASCQLDITSCDVQVRPNLLLCGTSVRDVSTFIPAGVDLNVVASCTPDADTQAMLITRSGVNLFDGPTIQAYVEGGGNVLTEAFGSDEVYNAVFGTAVAQAGLVGSCMDILPSVVQFNAGDPFWANNPFTAVPLLSTGCGHNVAAYPMITPLAGWSASEVAVGYRDAALGRVWVTEFDWQDGQVVDFDYSAELMGAMIIYPAL